jgi:hypothetical protein
MAVPLHQQAKVAAYIAKQKIIGRKRYPLVLMLEPLFKCNLACAGCGKIDYPDPILDKRLSVTFLTALFLILNIGLTAIHEIFHDEHNRLVQHIKDTVLAQLANGDTSFAAQWVVPGANLADGIQATEWNGARLFQAAKFGTETQYQHLVFEEFARKVAPTIHLFGNNDITLNPAITSEFANVVYRFGHSMLDENVNRYVIHQGAAGDPLNGTTEMYKAFTDAVTGQQTNAAVAGDGRTANIANAAAIIGTPVLNEISLIEAFTNPLQYLAHGGNAAGEIILGAANQVGNEIDEFITGALRNNLLGLPLDLAALNLARGRDVGVAGLNVIRNQLYNQAPTATAGNAAFHDTQLKPYASWDEFGQFLKHSSSLINFVASYGNHASVKGETTLIDKRMAAYDLVAEAQTSLSTTPLFVDGLGHLTNLKYTDAAGKHTSFAFKDAAGHYTNYGYLDAAGHAAVVNGDLTRAETEAGDIPSYHLKPVDRSSVGGGGFRGDGAHRSLE